MAQHFIDAYKWYSDQLQKVTDEIYALPIEKVVPLIPDDIRPTLEFTDIVGHEIFVLRPQNFEKCGLAFWRKKDVTPVPKCEKRILININETIKIPGFTLVSLQKAVVKTLFPKKTDYKDKYETLLKALNIIGIELGLEHIILDTGNTSPRQEIKIPSLQNLVKYPNLIEVIDHKAALYEIFQEYNKEEISNKLTFFSSRTKNHK